MAKKPTSFKSLRQVKRAMKNFQERHPDWKQYEQGIAKAAAEITEQGPMPMDLLLEKCYQIMVAKEMAKPLVEIARA